MNYLKYSDNFEDIKNIESTLVSGKIRNEKPLVTIAIPTYKRGDLLKQAIDSALNQKDFTDYEVIIVDNDDSRDIETEDLINSYNDNKLFYYRNEKNIGMTGNWNRCIELSRGKWVTILHDDDLLYPGFLTEMIRIIRSRKVNVDLLVSSIEIGEKANYLYNKNIDKVKRISIEKCILGNISPAPGILFKKHNAIQLGGFNAKFYPCMDYIFWINYCIKFNGYFTNRILGFYRICESNSTAGIYDKIINESYKIKKELSYLSCKSNFIKELLIKISLKNLISAYSRYIDDEVEYYKKYNIGLFYKNNFCFKIVNKIVNYKIN